MKPTWRHQLPDGGISDRDPLRPESTSGRDKVASPRSSGRRWMQTAVGVIVSVSLLAGVMRVSRVSWVPLGLLKDFWQLLVLAWLFRLAFSALLALRGKIILGLAGIRVGWGRMFRVTCVGHLPNLLIPAGLGSDLVRFAAIEQDSRQPPAMIVRALVVDRIFGLVALVLSGAGLLAVGYGQSHFGGASAVWAAVGLTVVAAIVYQAAKYTLPKLGRSGWFSQERSAQALLALGIGIAAHLALFASGAVLFETAAVVLPGLVRMQVLAAVSIAASFPVAIGGHGLREASLVLLLGYLPLWSQPPQPAPGAAAAAQLALVLLAFHVLSHLSIGSLAWLVQFVHPGRRKSQAKWI